MSTTDRKRRIVLTAAMVALGIGATVIYADLPPTDPTKIPFITLAGKTSVDVQSVSSFARAINQQHGTNAVLKHMQFLPGQNSGWHTHAGPNIVLMINGSLTVVDDRCMETQYGPGQGLASGLEVHEAIAGPEGAEFYSLYFLPENAANLSDAAPTVPVCARR
jgi:quercetin dioxygenase-like cupin family protein